MPEPRAPREQRIDSPQGQFVQLGGSMFGDINFGPTTGDNAKQPHEWARLVTQSPWWRHVPADRDVEPLRAHVTDAAVTLAGLCDAAVARIPEDPWYEPEFAARFVGHVDWLTGEPGEQPLELYPAEVALLVLMPLLYQVHHLQLAAELAVVEPWSLRPVSDPSPARASFEAFVERYATLLTRATLTPTSEHPIGWWLCHRWLVHHDDFAHEDTVGALCAELGEPLTSILEPTRTSTLLHGLRRGPGVCHPEYLATLRPDANTRRAGNQRIREQRLALLLALAFGMSLQMSALPDIVAEHLAVPDPVDLDRLRGSLADAEWTGSHHVPVLRAHCHHAAVIEGLREQTSRVDELLHAIHRTVRERITHPMPDLPARLSAHEVLPADGIFTGWASFRLDEHHIRELLMGEELYKDSDLAVRELYQNALDACRYRRARTDYINHVHNTSMDYEGSIVIEQSVDEDGRAYIECRDDGIGMGDAELRGVFAKAGARFAEQPDFKQEQAAWARLDPPVELFPNSRFGIGVLSYFMLAEEIRVTTCRMGLDGAPGAELEAVIYGPGHLFRIRQVAARGHRPGTTVRFYLKNKAPSWSVVDVLERLLGIAEFPTSARHGHRTATWTPGRFEPREPNVDHKFSVFAAGDLVPWPHAPAGVTVTWCARGGALLVDGLLVHPRTCRGVLASSPEGLAGVVVNLSGRHAPGRLSVDRRHVLDDISGQVATFLKQAANWLMTTDERLLSIEWMCRVTDEDSPLADILVHAAMAAGRTLACGTTRIDISQKGFLATDVEIARWRPDWYAVFDHHYFIESVADDNLPDDIYLWRLLTHRVHPELDVLTEFHPELNQIASIQLAVPSDFDLLFSEIGSQMVDMRVKPSVGRVSHLAEFGSQNRLTTRRTIDRISAFTVESIDLDKVDDTPVTAQSLWVYFDEDEDLISADRPATVNGIVQAANLSGTSVEHIVDVWRDHGVRVSDDVNSVALAAGDPFLTVRHKAPGFSERWLEPGDDVPLGHLARLSVDFDLDVSDVCDGLRVHGFTPAAYGLPSRPSDKTVAALSVDLDGRWPWLSHSTIVSPGYIIQAARSLDIAIMKAEELFRLWGFTALKIPRDATLDDVDILCKSDGVPIPVDPMRYLHLLRSRGSSVSPSRVVARLRDYGFEMPFRPAEHLDHIDQELLSADGPIDWSDETTHGIFPFAKAIFAASALNIDPSEIAHRLSGYGISVSCHTLPEGLTFSQALQLVEPLRRDKHKIGRVHLYTLNNLMALSRSMSVSPAQIVAWLNELGIPVPDVADSIRKALKTVPRA